MSWKFWQKTTYKRVAYFDDYNSKDNDFTLDEISNVYEIVQAPASAKCNTWKALYCRRYIITWEE